MIIGTATRVKDGAKPKPTRYYSKLQEDAVAKATGGKRTPNSGATDFGGKSDVDITNLFNIECKTKTSNSESISIKKEWLLKNKREATFDGNPYSAIAFNFGPDSNNYYIIEEYLFLELLDHLKTLDEPI
jgi:hypothetical protein